MKTTLIAALFFLLPISAGARSAFWPSLATLDTPSEVLYTEISHEGESLGDFALRVAPRARETTQALGSEICGAFQKRGSQHRIEFSTSHSEWGCNITFADHDDWKSTRITMHTHTEHGGHGFSDQDNQLRLQGFVVSFHTFTKRIGNIERTVRLP